MNGDSIELAAAAGRPAFHGVQQQLVVAGRLYRRGHHQRVALSSRRLCIRDPCVGIQYRVGIQCSAGSNGGPVITIKLQDDHDHQVALQVHIYCQMLRMHSLVRIFFKR